MSNISSHRTLELLASSYHFIDRRCRYHATDAFERRVLFERKTLRGQSDAAPRMLKGIRRIDSSSLGNVSHFAEDTGRSHPLRPVTRQEVKAQLCSVLVTATFVYALNRWKKAFSRMLETA